MTEAELRERKKGKDEPNNEQESSSDKKDEPEKEEKAEPQVVQAKPVTWSHITTFKGATPCPACGMEIELPESQGPNGKPLPPPPLVQCPGCRTVILNKAAAPVMRREGDDFRSLLCRWANPMIILTWSCIWFFVIFGITCVIPAVAEVGTPLYFVHLAFALWLAINVIFNYYAVVHTEPGFPTDIEYESCNSIAPFCAKCNYPKPARAHHCSTTGCCVLKMDHFCGFANNCIGHRNHRHFLLFACFIWLSALYATLMGLVPGAGMIIEYQEGTLHKRFGKNSLIGRDYTPKEMRSLRMQGMSNPNMTMLALVPVDLVGTFLLVVVGAITTTMISFLVYQQLSMVTQGLTVIDGMKLGGGTNPYDRGSMSKNLEMVLGRNWQYNWCIPAFADLPDDGMHFKPPPVEPYMPKKKDPDI